MKLFIGIDPGASGGFGVVDDAGNSICVRKFADQTERDIWDQLKEYSLSPDVGMACLEQVNAMPKQGVSSTFKFGTSYGFLRGLLAASSITYELVLPRKWQASLGCLTKGDKNISKAKAQQLFPSVKVTHAIADAMLIAEYARRTWVSRQSQSA